MTLDFGFYLSRFLRRLHWFVLFTAAGAAIGVTLALTLPPVYRAQAVLVVESPQIPGELAASTVQAGAIELLEILQQRILTRANLLDMAREFSIYEEMQAANPDDIIADMRGRIEIDLPGARDAAAFVFVSFPADDPTLSARVTNELVTQILQESVALRTASTGQTLDFFEQEVKRLGEDLGRAGAKILEFKMANKEALPDSLDFRRARQAQQQERLLQIERELASLRDRRTRLVDLYERTGRVDTATQPRSPEERQLQELRNELAGALLIYAPQNPRVTILEGRIRQLEAVVAAQSGVDPDAGLSAFDIQMGDIDGQIAFLAEQAATIEQELEEMKVSIDATPANAVTLDTLQRDYDNIQMQYNQAVGRSSAAATGNRIETLSRGQRITVIEQAVVPQEPESPNRRLVAAGGTGAGVVIGGGLVFLLEFLNRAIQRPAELTQRLGIAPFATVPYIRTRRETTQRRVIIGTAFALALVGIPAALYALHVYYLPLDLLVDRLLDRTGLGAFFATLGAGG